ncbi:MAG: alpha-amylase family protein [Candidatus Azobacteroides sp.]|nr:alpha-amylase family protein [Candidatus Azobacteroides sp.]
MEKIIIYQVLPRLFGNLNEHCKQNGTLEENGVGKFSDFTTPLLKKIKKMGYSHIWFTGVVRHATKTNYSSFGIPPSHPAVVKGNAGSPYAISDYYDICPDLADKVENRMEEFVALIDRVHKQGLKMLMDFVPNHVARQYKSIKKPNRISDLGAKDNSSLFFAPDNNFYYIPNEKLTFVGDGEEYTEFPAKVTGNDCFNAHPCHNDWYETIKLNYGIDFLNEHTKHFDPVPDTWKKMYDILSFWASKGVDGFRCDMAEMVQVEFWNWSISKIKEKHKNILFIAEIYNPGLYREYIQTGKFDYLYDKVGLYDTLRNVICGYEDAGAISRCWQNLGDLYPYMLNFLENHDEQRIASDFFAGNPFAGIPGMIVAATMNINPLMVYSGQKFGEKGMDAEGFSGKDGRTTIFDYWSIKTLRDWANEGKYNDENLSPEQVKLRDMYLRILKICNKEKAITDGLFYDLMYANYENSEFNSRKLYTYLRANEEYVLLFVINFDSSDIQTKINIPQHAFDFFRIPEKKQISCLELFSMERIRQDIFPGCLFETDIPAYSGRIYKWKK